MIAGKFVPILEQIIEDELNGTVLDLDQTVNIVSRGNALVRYSDTNFEHHFFTADHHERENS